MNAPEKNSGRPVAPVTGEALRGHIVTLEVAVDAMRSQLADMQALATAAGHHTAVGDLKVVDAALAESKKALVVAANHVKK